MGRGGWKSAGGKAKPLERRRTKYPMSNLGDALILPAEALFPRRCSCTYSQEASETEGSLFHFTGEQHTLVNGEGWCRESVTKNTGQTGEGRRLLHSRGLSNIVPQL